MALDNLFGLIQRQRLFQPSTPNLPVSQDDGTDTPTPKIPNFSLEEPPTPAMDAYRQQIGTMPNRADYKPGLLGKILSGVAGFATMDPVNAYKTSRGISDAPYNRALGDYEVKSDQLGKLAGIEERGNASKIKLKSDAAKINLDWTKELREQGKTEADIKNIQSQIQNRGFRPIKSDVDGHTYLVDNQGNKTDLGQFAESLDAKDARGLKDFSFKEGIKTNNERSLIGTRFGNEKALKDIELGNNKTLADYRGGIDKDVHSANRTFDVNNPIANGNNTYVNPSQSQNAHLLAVEKVLADNPSFDRWVFRDPNTKKITATVPPSAKGWFNDKVSIEDTKDWNDFNKKVNDAEDGIVNRKRTSPSNPLTPKEVKSTKVSRDDVINEIKKNYPGRPDLLTNEKYIQSVLESNNAN